MACASLPSSFESQLVCEPRPGGAPCTTTSNTPAARVAGAVRVVHLGFHALLGVRVGTVEQHLVLRRQRHELFPRDGPFQLDASDRDDMAQHLDAKLPQQEFRESARGNPRRGFTGAGTLEDVASLRVVVLDAARKVRVSRPGPVDRFGMFARIVEVLDRQRSGPVVPVPIPEEDGDGRADGLAVPDAGHDMHPVGLDLHPPPRPKPCWRRQRSRLMRSRSTGTPAGMPDTVATSVSP